MYATAIINPDRAVMILATSTDTLIAICTFMGDSILVQSRSAARPRRTRGRALVVTKSQHLRGGFLAT